MTYNYKRICKDTRKEEYNSSWFSNNIRLSFGFVIYLRGLESVRVSANCFKLSSNKFTDNFAFRYTLLNPSLCFAINVVSRDNVMTFRFPRN